jgi:hypothetical protein
MRPLPEETETVKLLWTGGWDSTFRLLQLLLLDRRFVQPYYLIDARRPSIGAEIRAMSDIKNLLFKEHQGTRDLLRPTEYTEVTDILPAPEITEAYRTIVESSFIGSQYDWLARFCKQKGTGDIELCIHRDDTARAVLAPYLEGQTGCRVVCSSTTGDVPEQVYALFRYFRFPMFGLSKLDMAATVQEQHWTALMDMTWFCHRPRGGKPCGMCNPCLYTQAEGLGWRIPLSRRAASRFHRMVLRPVRRTTKAVREQFKHRFPWKRGSVDASNAPTSGAT